MSDPSIASVLGAAERRLAAAGVDSPGTDASLLLAHAWGLDSRGLSRARLMGDPVPPEVLPAFVALVERRAARVPVQHLTGVAHFRTLTLPVGPGVFVPRPETELLVDPVLAHLSRTRPDGGARVLDLCTGTGVLGLAVAAEAAGTSAVGVEIDPAAAEWARRSTEAVSADLAAAGSTFVVVDADATDRAAVRAVVDDHLAGGVDAVVSNPPYVVDDGTTTAPEVVDHDPATALWGGGDDGTRLPREIIAAAAHVLADGGLLVLEHADTQGALLREASIAAGFAQVTTHADYTGRDRFTTAVRQPHLERK